ncbi:methyltransferase, FxLD system [Actinoallomurus purpureus]|uniref:methyltransferase, FxLD system n=1 Tax=Actinoallomurus purpureus TaxID=478114 RepID=UPI0020932D2E|nr:methyltransferase, FxLD system [Actinoallomurus purpureus]MCO6004748.1 methyltransferase, FxLD system [Actinoallomurus purpureus]
MTPTDSAQKVAPDPERVQALIDTLHRFNRIGSPAVEAAFRAVPRHAFLPGVDLDEAYAPRVVVTKRATDGSALSSASSPVVVAGMLNQLDAQPGNRILEIGAGTGINAALLAELTGPSGHVTTIDIDPEVTDGARAGLAAAGYRQVEVICADGALGHSPRAPYDRIIVTAGAWDIAPAWWQQLAVGGRLVVPLRLHGSDLTRSIAFTNHGDRLVSDSVQVCGFIPLIGAAGHAGHRITLGDDLTLSVRAGGTDDDALRDAMNHPSQREWTGVIVNDNDPIEHLDLWLATIDSDRFARMSAGPKARENGVADPARRWGGAAIHDSGTLAYITRRELDDDTAELGVIAHGPDSRCLADRLARLLHTWDQQRPTQPRITAYPVNAPDDEIAGTVIHKPHSRLVISWPSTG